MRKRIIAVALTLFILLCAIPVYAESNNFVRILFTNDMHSHLEMAARLGGSVREEKENWGSDNLFILDAGDFSQGTFYQCGYEEYAFELGLLSKLGYDYFTLGNHEWDHGGAGLANMLSSAAKLYDNLPGLLCSNIDYGSLETEEQKKVYSAINNYNKKAGINSPDYSIVTMENGLKIGIFAVSGKNSIDCSPTSGMLWLDYIQTAKRVVSELEGKCDAIICLSHSGTTGTSAGEDQALAEAVPEIDLIISGHSHTVLDEPMVIGTTTIVSCGDNMRNLGCIDMIVGSDESISFGNYRLKPLVYADINPVTELYISRCDESIKDEYLASFGYNAVDQIIAHSSFDFMTREELYSAAMESDIGNIIADSYIYEARKNGINDIDVAIVANGTIRDTIYEGDITVEQAFMICSLGAGVDGSSGHPLVAAYMTGKELKILAELDASIGSMYQDIKMNYSGLRLKYNSCRMLFDRTVDVSLYDEFGILGEREIEDDKLYKVCCNMSAYNMIGMINGLTKDILSITPKDANGNVVTDLYSCQLIGSNDEPIKEWVAFADYLAFLKEVPEDYHSPQGRIIDTKASDIESRLEKPGLTTWAVIVAAVLAILILVLIVKLIRFLILKILRPKKSSADDYYRR